MKIFLPIIIGAAMVVSGLTFNQVYDEAKETVTDFAYHPSGKIYATAHGQIVASDDGGSSWYIALDELPLGDPSLVTDVTVLSSGAVLFGATTWMTGSPLVRTIDNGITWQSVSPPNLYGIYEIVQLSSGAIVAVGLDKGPDRGSVYRSVNNGTTWTRVAFFPAVHRFVSVAAKGNTVLAGGDAGNFYRSTDGGINWTFVSQVNIYRDVTKIIAASDGNFYAVAVKGSVNWEGSTLFKSTNNGASWTVQYQDTLIALCNLMETDDGEFYSVVTDGNAIQKTARLGHSTDFGATWEFTETFREDAFNWDDTRFGLLRLPIGKFLVGIGNTTNGFILRGE